MTQRLLATLAADIGASRQGLRLPVQPCCSQVHFLAGGMDTLQPEAKRLTG